jgi:hypothetical protein
MNFEALRYAIFSSFQLLALSYIQMFSSAKSSQTRDDMNRKHFMLRCYDQ